MTIETLTPQLSLYARPRKLKVPRFTPENPWSSVCDKAMALKQQPSKPKKYSLKGMKTVIQACGLFGTASQRVHVQKPKMVDAWTQTEELYVPTPRKFSKKFENVYCTPEANRIPQELFASSTPMRNDRSMRLVMNNINLDSESKQKVINALTPKRNILLNCNNFTTPKTNNVLFNNVTPVSSQKWRSNYATPSSGKRSLHSASPKHISPASASKFYKLIGKTRDFQKKYAIATVKLFKDACYWFRNITKQSDNVDNVVKNNVNVAPAMATDPKKGAVCKIEEMFHILREEMQEVKNMVEELRKRTSNGIDERVHEVKKENIPIVTISPCIPAPPPPPPPMSPLAPPPPPPPPPMPLMMASTTSLPKLARKKENDSKKEDKSNGSRPSISLEDILKVKLRKPCDRSKSLPKPPPRRLGTPVVTMDVLKQVRLRPVASAQSLPIRRPRGSESSNDSGIEKSSNSPMSNLKRLLTNRPYSEDRPRRKRHALQRANANQEH